MLVCNSGNHNGHHRDTKLSRRGGGMDDRTLVTVCLLIPIDPIHIMVNHFFEIRPYLAEDIVSSISTCNSSINLFDVTINGCTVEIGNTVNIMCVRWKLSFLSFLYITVQDSTVFRVCVFVYEGYYDNRILRCSGCYISTWDTFFSLHKCYSLSCLTYQRFKNIIPVTFLLVVLNEDQRNNFPIFIFFHLLPYSAHPKGWWERCGNIYLWTQHRRDGSSSQWRKRKKWKNEQHLWESWERIKMIVIYFLWE